MGSELMVAMDWSDEKAMEDLVIADPWTSQWGRKGGRRRRGYYCHFTTG
jgi:hypothetical protein